MTWYEIFPNLLNMSMTASVIILFVLLADCFNLKEEVLHAPEPFEHQELTGTAVREGAEQTETEIDPLQVAKGISRR